MKNRSNLSKTMVIDNPSDEQMADMIGYIHGRKDTQLLTLTTSEAGIGALKNMRKNLDVAGNKLLRIVSENGDPLNARQATRIDTYFKESQRIKHVLQKVEDPIPANSFEEIIEDIGNFA